MLKTASEPKAEMMATSSVPYEDGYIYCCKKNENGNVAICRARRSNQRGVAKPKAESKLHKRYHIQGDAKGWVQQQLLSWSEKFASLRGFSESHIDSFRKKFDPAFPLDRFHRMAANQGRSMNLAKPKKSEARREKLAAIQGQMKALQKQIDSM